MNRSFRAQESLMPSIRPRMPQLRSLKEPMSKEKEDDLALFLEMRKREKERNDLLQNSEELDESPDAGLQPGCAPLFSIPSAPPARKTVADEFLNSDNDKNDYDWLLTPPGTPLFPSLDMESRRAGHTEAEAPNARSVALKSRQASSKQEATTRTGLISRQHSFSGLSTSTSGVGLRRPSSSGGPASRPASSGGSASRPATPMSRSSTTSRPATPTGRPTLTSSSRTSRPSTPTSRPTLTSSKSSISTSSVRPTSASISSRSNISATSGKSTAPPRSSTPTRSSTPSRSTARSSTPTSRTTTVPAPPTTSSRLSTPTRRPSTPSRAPPGGTTSRVPPGGTTARAPPGGTISRAPSGGTISRVPSGGTSISSLTRSSSSVSKGGSAVSSKNPGPSRGASPTVRSRPWKPSEMPGFSLDAPPNLRTTLPDRPLSATRGRPAVPAARSSSVEPNANSGRQRRQSCSPSRGRAPNGVPSSHISGGSIPAVNRGHSRVNDDVSPVVIGSKMVDRVVGMRKLAPPRQDDKHSPSLSGKSGSSPDSSGFGRTLSKKSLDMAIRHMDIRRTIPGNLRPLMTNVPASSMYSVRSGQPTRSSRTVSVSDSPLATSSNASSEFSVSNNGVGFLDGRELEDYHSSERW